MSGSHTDRLRQLKRRRDYLKTRIANYRGNSDSFDKAEAAAITWAISVVEAAIATGAIYELEDYSRPTVHSEDRSTK